MPVASNDGLRIYLSASLSVHTYTHTLTHIARHIQTCVHECTYVCMYIYIYMYTHILMCIHLCVCCDFQPLRSPGSFTNPTQRAGLGSPRKTSLEATSRTSTRSCTRWWPLVSSSNSREAWLFYGFVSVTMSPYGSDVSVYIHVFAWLLQ